MRITVFYSRENGRNNTFIGSISGQEGADFFPNCIQLTEQNAT